MGASAPEEAVHDALGRSQALGGSSARSSIVENVCAEWPLAWGESCGAARLALILFAPGACSG